MTREFIKNLGGDDEETALEPGVYEVRCIDARTVESSPKLAFLDLQVLSGPDKGKATTVSLYFPEDHERGAQFHFRKKVRGFVSKLHEVDVSALNDDEQVAALVEAIIDAEFEAKLDQQKKGDYAGRQELIATKPLDGDNSADWNAPESNAADDNETSDADDDAADDDEADDEMPDVGAADDDDELPF